MQISILPVSMLVYTKRYKNTNTEKTLLNCLLKLVTFAAQTWRLLVHHLNLIESLNHVFIS